MLFLIALKLLCNIIFTMIDHVHCPYWFWLKKIWKRKMWKFYLSHLTARLLHCSLQADPDHWQFDYQGHKNVLFPSRTCMRPAQVQWVCLFFRCILILILLWPMVIKINTMSANLNNTRPWFLWVCKMDINTKALID